MRLNKMTLFQREMKSTGPQLKRLKNKRLKIKRLKIKSLKND
jgi:hypothetical protein